jgi:glycosyltransferase involved in cell wall biosynthesis
MLSRQPGHVTGQSEILAGLFEQAGYSVIAISHKLNRLARLTDILLTLLRRRKEYDIAIIDVFSYRSFLVSDLASRAAQMAKKPIIFFLHGGSLPEFFAKHPDRAQKVLRRPRQLLAPSRFLARSVEPFHLPVEVIPNVLDISSYPYRHRDILKPRLFWMRTFHPLYNPELAIRTLHRLRPEFPDIHLTMAGQDKGLEPQVRHLSSELGVDNNVRFVGFLNAEGKTREGGNADIFLNTNRVDNMPVSVLEACAMGIPVIATSVGGIPDLLEEGKTGLLVEDDNDCAMAEAVKRLLTDPALAAKLSANGREMALNSSWERVRLRWEQVFARIQGESHASL